MKNKKKIAKELGLKGTSNNVLRQIKGFVSKSFGNKPISKLTGIAKKKAEKEVKDLFNYVIKNEKELVGKAKVRGVSTKKNTKVGLFKNSKNEIFEKLDNEGILSDTEKEPLPDGFTQDIVYYMSTEAFSDNVRENHTVYYKGVEMKKSEALAALKKEIRATNKLNEIRREKNETPIYPIVTFEYFGGNMYINFE